MEHKDASEIYLSSDEADKEDEGFDESGVPHKVRLCFISRII